MYRDLKKLLNYVHREFVVNYTPLGDHYSIHNFQSVIVSKYGGTLHLTMSLLPNYAKSFSIVRLDDEVYLVSKFVIFKYGPVGEYVDLFSKYVVFNIRVLPYPSNPILTRKSSKFVRRIVSLIELGIVNPKLTKW
jgi:hypothetical protein